MTMRIDFEREKAWWDEKAPREDADTGDTFINRALHWREIERHLEGVQTILEVGGGTGFFSIPLAERGFEVTHLDFSPAMLAIARERGGHLPNLHFVEANAIAIPFEDASFDLVMNIGGAISFCGSEAENSLRESCRVTGKKLIVSVLNRGHIAAACLLASIQCTGHVQRQVQVMFECGQWHQEQFEDNALLAGNTTQGYIAAMKAFLPTELACILQGAGLQPCKIHALGSLVRWYEIELLQKIREQPVLYEEFLTLCERFDHDIMPGGPGTRDRMGLIAVAKR
jgi:SAM-dependent methyltransferase